MKFYIVFIVIYNLIIQSAAILDRDYYNYLQLPVSATPDLIREAFRRLSKKYHPDRNPQSKDRFQKINVAYQTLMDDHKKYLYDRLGKQKVNQPNIQQQFNMQSLKGPQLRMKINLPLKDFYQGKIISVLVQKQVACPHCHGSGAQNPYDIVRCNECGGKGQIQQRVQLGNGYYNLFTNICGRCQGKGKIIGRKCSLCHAQKIIQGVEEIDVKVLPGTANNAQLKYINMGDQRLDGAPSDLIFHVTQIPHPYFRREGENLFFTQVITLRQALLGYNKKVIHLDGREIYFSSEEITQPDQIRVIQNQGMPILNEKSRGHLFIQFKVEIPNLQEDQLIELQDFFERHSIQ